MSHSNTIQVEVLQLEGVIPVTSPSELSQLEASPLETLFIEKSSKVE